MNASSTTQAHSNPITKAGADILDRRGWLTLLVLCGILFLDGLDVSMVGIALPSIERDLHLSTSTLQWVVSGYVLGYGGLLLLGGRTADLLGRRQTLLVALAVFAAASIFGTFVSSGPLLIASRFVKGASAAFTAPASLSIITTTFPEGPARNRALGIYTATGASGFSMGLVLGGLLTTIGWRFTFLLPVPIALALLAVAPRVLRRDEPSERAEGNFDIAGAALITTAMLALVYGVSDAPQAGWTSARTIVALVAAAVLGTAFVQVEQRVKHPLVRLGLFRVPGVLRANLAAMAMFGCYVGFQFIGTLYMQQLLGWSALGTAMAFLPAGLIVAFAAPRIGGLATRVGTTPLIAIGMVAFVTGYALFLRIGADPTYAGIILPTILLLGVGFALTFPSVNMAATTGVADHEQGLASGLVSTSIQLGGALVLSVVTAVVTAQSGSGTSASSLLDGFRPGLGVVTAVAVLGLATAASGLAWRARFARFRASDPAPCVDC
ncbi:MAG TPA: MFS transporter [Thermoleophilaceae bacterium]|jgi:EmrB/QacA subfamily drug resistance transporter